jgi:hypothetical protein
MSAPALGSLEVWQLRHESHNFAFAATGQALRLRRLRLRLTLRRSIAPVRYPSTFLDRSSWRLFVPLFTGVRGSGILRTSHVRSSTKFAEKGVINTAIE